MDIPASGPDAIVAGQYEIGVAIMPLSANLADGSDSAGKIAGIPGYEDTIGRGAGQRADRPGMIQKGEAALDAAIDSIAGRIELIAQRISSALASSAQSPEQAASAPELAASVPEQAAPAVFGIESVQVSFGITLSAGLQTVFTAQAESSAQVTLTLSRQS